MKMQDNRYTGRSDEAHVLQAPREVENGNLLVVRGTVKTVSDVHDRQPEGKELTLLSESYRSERQRYGSYGTA